MIEDIIKRKKLKNDNYKNYKDYKRNIQKIYIKVQNKQKKNILMIMKEDFKTRKIVFHYQVKKK